MKKVNTPDGLKIGPRLLGTPGAPGGEKITPGDPRDHFRIFCKISVFLKLSYFIILTRFRHFWMPDSNSALKVSQDDGFKPGFGHFL